MDWFRMYSEFATDAKVQIMSEANQRRLMMIFCLRCSNALVTLHETEIAFQLRISNDELAETKALFIAKGFIDEQWEVMNWDKRQFVSDSSAARVAKHRALKKEAENTHETPCNVTVTPQIQIQNRYRTDKDIPANPAPEKPISKAKAKKPFPLPDDFAISDRVTDWAQEKKHTDLPRHFENFVSAAKAKGYVYVDWDEALMKAIRENWAKVEVKAARGLVL